MLEEDGIKCFDLDRNSLLMGLENESEDFDLRQSIGLNNRSKILSVKSTKQTAEMPPPVAVSEV